MNLKRFVPLVSFMALAASALPAFAQGLGDVAKKEEERRKGIAAPAKVYTNQDLAAVPESATVPPSPSATDASTKPDQDKAKEDKAKEKDPKDKGAAKDQDPKDKGSAKDQAYWAGRRKTLQDQLDRNSTLADALQSRINALSADFVNKDDPAQRRVIAQNRDKASAELTQLKLQIGKDQKALADLDEEARRAGVPPGWLR
jgi:hypothetical protein